jgi:hypothetical protein
MSKVFNQNDYKSAADIPRSQTINEDGFIIKLKRCRTEFCLIEEISINGKEVFFFDLGTVNDLDPDNAPTCGCANRQFIPKTPSNDTLKTLEMDMDEYARLMEVLKKHLNVGYCKRCR